MARTRDDIIAEASRWVAEKRSGEMTAEQRTALWAWLSEHPDNLKTFDEIERLAISASTLRSLADLEPKPASPHAIAPTRRRRLAHAIGPRSRPILLSAIAASIAAALIILPSMPKRAMLDSATAVAETRVLVLADGTRVTLGPKSRIRTSLAGAERHAEMVYGEAFFEVAHDRNRPFIVDAGDTRVRVLGTRFDVKSGGGRVSTSVLDGVVQVSEEAPLFGKTPLHVLRAYQQVETKAEVTLFDARSTSTVVRVEAPPGEWREGRLTYSNARLADVVADLNRYYAPGIEIDAKLAEARIATTFTRDDMESFFANLPIILPVEVRRNGTGRVTIARRAGG